MSNIHVTSEPFEAYDVAAYIDEELVFSTRFRGNQDDVERFKEKLIRDLTNPEPV